MPHYLSVFLGLLAYTASVRADLSGSPRSGLLKRDTQLSCGTEAFGQFDALCTADDGTTVCASRLDTCCQLPNGQQPYTCPGLGDAHCCGVDSPACGSDPSCKNAKGDIDTEPAESPVVPTEIEVTAAPSPTTTRGGIFGPTGEQEQQPLMTLTGEKNPNATGGARVLGARMKEEGALAVLAAAMALI